MLRRLGKFGAIHPGHQAASVGLLSPPWGDILANVGCLAVFQVAGNDARQLVWELGKERVSEDDIVSLDVHHCYVRATVGRERLDAFSMEVMKPEAGDPATAARLRAASAAYVTAARDLSASQAGPAKKVTDYHGGLDALRNDGNNEETEKETVEKEEEREESEEREDTQPRPKHKPRTRNPQPPEAGEGDEGAA